MPIQSLNIKQVIIRILVIITAAEFLIMLLIRFIPFQMSLYQEAFVDAILLALLSTPLIYAWVIKPFVTARDVALKDIHQLAHTDPLTKLANRRLLLIHLERLIAGNLRHETHGAVLLIDLDGFKVINDTYGHTAGDAVLIKVANRIKSSVRIEDVTARLGGDEFVILLHQLDDNEKTAQDTALKVAVKVINLIKKPINFNGMSLNVAASIGIKLLGYDNENTKTAIQDADAAMYQAKQNGGSCAVLSGECNDR